MTAVKRIVLCLLFLFLLTGCHKRVFPPELETVYTIYLGDERSNVIPNNETMRASQNS